MDRNEDSESGKEGLFGQVQARPRTVQYVDCAWTPGRTAPESGPWVSGYRPEWVLLASGGQTGVGPFGLRLDGPERVRMASGGRAGVEKKGPVRRSRVRGIGREWLSLPGTPGPSKPTHMRVRFRAAAHRASNAGRPAPFVSIPPAAPSVRAIRGLLLSVQLAGQTKPVLLAKAQRAVYQSLTELAPVPGRD